MKSQSGKRILAPQLPCCEICPCPVRKLLGLVFLQHQQPSHLHHINQQKNRLKCDPIGIALVRHDAQSLIEVPVEAFDYHRVMVPSAENMTIDFQKVESFPTNAKKLAVFVKDAGMAKAKSQYDLHDSRRVRCRVGVGDRLHHRNMR
jgi:hypothetical protein